MACVHFAIAASGYSEISGKLFGGYSAKRNGPRLHMSKAGAGDDQAKS